MYSLSDISVTLLTSQFPIAAMNLAALLNTVEGGCMRIMMECTEEEEKRTTFV